MSESSETSRCAECRALLRRLEAAARIVNWKKIKAARDARDAHNREAHGRDWVRL